MLQGFTGWPHLLILLAVVLLLFGATKLPALARSVGQSMKVFRSEMKTDDSKDSADSTALRVQRVRQGQRSVRQVLTAMAAREPRSRNPERRMSLGQHLVELRKRLFRAALAVVAGTIARLVPLRPRRLEPAQRADHQHRRVATARTRAPVALNFNNITGGFDIHLQVAIVIGIVISSPIWLYQVFAFFVPGLNEPREEVHLRLLLHRRSRCSSPAATAGWFVLPHIVELMASFVPAGSTSLYDTKYYLDFVLKLVLATGIAFVLPVFLVLLNFVGVHAGQDDPQGLALGDPRRSPLFTAIATPAADVVSMFLLAIPMVFLYFVAVVRRALARPRRGPARRGVRGEPVGRSDDLSPAERYAASRAAVVRRPRARRVPRRGSRSTSTRSRRPRAACSRRGAACSSRRRPARARRSSPSSPCTSRCRTRATRSSTRRR